MRLPVAAAAAVAFAVSATAFAEEVPPWSVSPFAGLTVMGGERTTGGLTLGATGRHEWALGERIGVRVGVRAEVIGVGGEGRWLGMLSSPIVGSTATVTDWLQASLDIDGGFGRVATCNDWGLCMRFWGTFPGVDIAISWVASKNVRAGAACSARVVRTLAWSGASFTPRADVTVAW